MYFHKKEKQKKKTKIVKQVNSVLISFSSSLHVIFESLGNCSGLLCLGSETAVIMEIKLLIGIIYRN